MNDNIVSGVLDSIGIGAAWMMTATAVLIPAWFLWMHFTGSGNWRTFRTMAVITTIFQVFHLLEHGIQMFQWTGDHSTTAMTPIAWLFERGFAIIVGHPGSMPYGMEWLHLLGNVIFLTGLYAWRQSGYTGKWARWAFNFQAWHVAEHVTLTATMTLFGTPIGLSTLFGYAPHLPAPWGSSIRIWFHFMANAIATGMICVAVAKGKWITGVTVRRVAVAA